MKIRFAYGQKSRFSVKARLGCLGMAFTLALSSWTFAQQRGQMRTPPASPPMEAPGGNNSVPGSASLLTDTQRDYLIAPGDVVEVWIEDAPELSRNYRVNAAGDFPMDIIGRMPARDKTAEELAQQISSRLREAEYLIKPNVVVTIRQFNSQTFIIQGSVGKPGVYQLEGRPNLLTLIGLAGGLLETHGSTAYILRPKARATDKENAAPQTVAATTTDKTAEAKTVAAKPEAVATSDATTTAAATTETATGEAATANDDAVQDDYELIRVNLSALYKGHFENNQTLEPRDIVNIPRADVFFVAGEVNSPGSFPLKEGTTLRQAISLAQGLTFKAKAGNGVIFREDPDNGKRQELKIDISAVMNGKREDMVINANDVIIIPNSRTKSVSSALLTALGVNSARIPIRY